VTITEPICKTLTYALRIFVKKSHTEFHEDPTQGSVAHTGLQTDGRGHANLKFFAR